MSCTKFKSWIEDEASGALGARESRLLSDHAAHCPGCSARRAAIARLARELGAIRRAIPEMDVVARVMEAVRAEARARELRACVGARAFWGSMAASFACVSLLAALAALAGRSALSLTAEAIPPPGPILRIAIGCWTTVKSLTVVLFTLVEGLLDAAVHIMHQSPYALPVAEAVMLAALAAAMLAGALPLARVLRPLAPRRRSAGE